MRGGVLCSPPFWASKLWGGRFQRPDKPIIHASGSEKGGQSPYDVIISFLKETSGFFDFFFFQIKGIPHVKYWYYCTVLVHNRKIVGGILRILLTELADCPLTINPVLGNG